MPVGLCKTIAAGGRAHASTPWRIKGAVLRDPTTTTTTATTRRKRRRRDPPTRAPRRPSQRRVNPHRRRHRFPVALSASVHSSRIHASIVHCFRVESRVHRGGCCRAMTADANADKGAGWRGGLTDRRRRWPLRKYSGTVQRKPYRGCKYLSTCLHAPQRVVFDRVAPFAHAQQSNMPPRCAGCHQSTAPSPRHPPQPTRTPTNPPLARSLPLTPLSARSQPPGPNRYFCGMRTTPQAWAAGGGGLIARAWPPRQARTSTGAHPRRRAALGAGLIVPSETAVSTSACCGRGGSGWVGERRRQRQTRSRWLPEDVSRAWLPCATAIAWSFRPLSELWEVSNARMWVVRVSSRALLSSASSAVRSGKRMKPHLVVERRSVASLAI